VLPGCCCARPGRAGSLGSLGALGSGPTLALRPGRLPRRAGAGPVVSRWIMGSLGAAQRTPSTLWGASPGPLGALEHRCPAHGRAAASASRRSRLRQPNRARCRTSRGEASSLVRFCAQGGVSTAPVLLGSGALPVGLEPAAAEAADGGWGVSGDRFGGHWRCFPLGELSPPAPPGRR